MNTETEYGKTEPMSIAQYDDELRKLEEKFDKLKESVEYAANMRTGDFHYVQRLLLEALERVR